MTACVTETEGNMFDRMTDLLRRRPHQFDVPSALLSLPGTNLNVIAPFVNFAVREALHEKRMKMVFFFFDFNPPKLYLPNELSSQRRWRKPCYKWIDWRAVLS